MSDNESDTWPYCPRCGAELESPAGPFREWTDCPNCGRVCVEFYRKTDGGDPDA